MGRQGVSRSIAAAALALAIWAAPASAAPLTVPTFGQFRAVLAQGEGQTVTAPDLAAYQLTGNPPQTFTSQTPLYAGIMPHASTLTPADLDVALDHGAHGIALRRGASCD